MEIAVYRQHTYMNVYTSMPKLITDVNISFYNNDAGSLHRHRWRKNKKRRKIKKKWKGREKYKKNVAALKVMNHNSTWFSSSCLLIKSCCLLWDKFLLHRIKDTSLKVIIDFRLVHWLTFKSINIPIPRTHESHALMI